MSVNVVSNRAYRPSGEAPYEVAPLCGFAGLSLARGSAPDETTILNFQRLLETHALAPKQAGGGLMRN